MFDVRGFIGLKGKKDSKFKIRGQRLEGKKKGAEGKKSRLRLRGRLGTFGPLRR